MSQIVYSSEDLQRFIEENRIQATILPMSTHTPTVSDAARALKVSTDEIIKSLVFQIKKESILVINNGLARVDRRKIAAYLEIGRSQVKFASPQQALAITGFVVGSMPPFGHLTKLRTLVDLAVKDLDIVYGGGGDIDAMLKIQTSELLSVTEAEVIALSEI